MRYVRLGQSGLKISCIALGMLSYGDPAIAPWHLPEDAAEPIIRHAVEAGVTYFDTADRYSMGMSEVVTGRVLSRLFPHRDDYVLATKVYYPSGDGPNDKGLSRKHILASIDASLRRLGTDYVDLYQIHRWDAETPIEETMAALHHVVQSGKARYIGASTMAAWQFAKAQQVAERGGWTRFVSMQNHYNLLYREEEREMIPLCLDQGVGVVPWSPLAKGFLAGTRDRAGRKTARASSDNVADALYDYDETDYSILEAVQALAAQRGESCAQVALAWLLSKPGVTAPIVGATKIGHLDDAVAAAGARLSDDEIKLVEAPYRARPVNARF
jgi:aryl-alcohol dehydrogenase-like predicted oxidoreductase